MAAAISAASCVASSIEHSLPRCTLSTSDTSSTHSASSSLVVWPESYATNTCIQSIQSIDPLSHPTIDPSIHPSISFRGRATSFIHPIRASICTLVPLFSQSSIHLSLHPYIHKTRHPCIHHTHAPMYACTRPSIRLSVHPSQRTSRLV